MNRSIVLGLVICLAGPLLAAQADAQTPRSRPSFTLADGVVIDPGKGEAYIATPAGGVAAVQLGDGAEKWRSEAAVRPLGVNNGLVFGQAAAAPCGNLAAGRAIVIVGLDAADAGRLKTTTPITVPDNVVAVAGPSTLGDLAIHAAASGTHELFDWRFTWRGRSGAWHQHNWPRPAPERPDGVMAARDLPANPGATTSGAFVIDTASGALLPQAQGALLRVQSAELSKGAYPVTGSPPGKGEISSADGLDTAKIEILGNDALWDRFRWTIKDAATGKVLGTFAAHFPYAPFFVHGSSVVIEITAFTRRETDGRLVSKPLTLAAVSLDGGGKLWAVPVFDPRARSVRPP